MSKVDTRVRHVTKPGANLFAELGFAPEEDIARLAAPCVGCGEPQGQQVYA